MEQLFKIFLTLHIIGGILGIACGTINIIRKKGDKIHRLIGKGFLYGMLTSGFISLILASMHPNMFLFIIGIFTIFLVGTGQRYLSLRNLTSGQKPVLIDWALTLMMLVSGIVFVGLGINIIFNNDTFGIVFIVFGSVGLFFTRKDFRNYQGHIAIKNYWLIEHINRMIAGYIASLTALLVVNGSYFTAYIPTVLLWLLPTIVLVPFIIYWTRKFKVKIQLVDTPSV